MFHPVAQFLPLRFHLIRHYELAIRRGLQDRIFVVNFFVSGVQIRLQSAKNLKILEIGE